MYEEGSLVRKKYHNYLLLEKAASNNTIDGYESDLDKFFSFLEANNLSYKDVTLEHLHLFMILLHDLCISTRSQARIVSGLRSFYRFLVLDKDIDANPTDMLESPKLGMHLPEVLSLSEIDAMIACIDLSKFEGHRNRAIIETLYSCGLRVSELINLKISNLYLDEEYIKVEGKGKKQRLVPISQTAIHEIHNYCESMRNHLTIKRQDEDILFLNRRGARLTRVMIFTIVKQLAEEAGIKKNISPHTFRHSFASHLLEGGANLRMIQEMLGHESLVTTEIYTHIDMTMLRDTILHCHPRNLRK